MQFWKNSYCIFYGNHTDVLQRMLDYDFLCGRDPSVKAIVVNDNNPQAQKVFFWNKEIFVPQVNDRSLLEQYGPFDTLINFASYRTAPSVIKEAMQTKLFQNIFTVAEGIPEKDTREIIALNKEYNINLIWPSVVGGIVAGALRVGNTWWSLDNIIKSKLYRPGSVAIVTKSGGMMNELCRVVSKVTDGVHTAIQVWWDRYPMTSFQQVISRYQNHPEIKLIVLLGEVGNEDENRVADMIKSGQITKPVVARVAGTSAEQLQSDVQFGHAGAKANADAEKATYKNNYLKQAGAHVPTSYDAFGELIGEVFDSLSSSWMQWNETKDLRGNKNSSAMPQNDALPESISQRLTAITNRRPTAITSTISDERGEELTYNSIPVTEFVEKWSIANVIGHLRFKQQLPDYALDFLNTAIILMADHGPAVSGATNTIITARAGKDVVSSLAAWLLTIGPRFGGAVSGAGQYFFQAVQDNLSAKDFIESMKQQGIYIPGIGHKIKSIYNPDKRCDILFSISKKFPQTKHLDFAKQVEALTTMKKPNLILNVDGHVAALLLDMMEGMWYTTQQIQQYIDADVFNGLFVLARSIGFIWHHIDQKRLGEGLYRTPWDDILYT